MAKKSTKNKQAKKPPKQTAQRAKKTASKPQKATPRNATKPQKKQTKKPPKQTASKKAKKTASKPQGVERMVLVPVLIKDYRDNNGGHHHVIMDSIDENHISVGLTKDKYKGRNATNYHCKISPLEDGAVSYIRRQAQVAPIKDYYNPRGGKMEQGDYERAKVYTERAKQKYLDKKNSNEVPNA